MNKEKQVLIIDDDNRNIFALSAVLKAKGFTVCSALSMKETFTILERNHAIGVILMDMMMPDMDGYEATAALKQHDQYGHIPIIAVTAKAMQGDREKSLQAGADDYIPKPVDVDLLLHRLEEHLK
jgi:two-component system, cell cycle response regulator DivK